MSAHAELSPSSAARWLSCPGSVTLSRGIEDTGSDAAAEGTMLHTVSALCLEGEFDAVRYVGIVDADTGLTMTEDHALLVQQYVDAVRLIRDTLHGELMVEQRLPIGWMTGEEGAAGTTDALIISKTQLVVIDAKFGFKPVDAVDNPQLLMYAAAAHDTLRLAYDFETIRLVIVQPRVDGISEWILPVADLDLFVDGVRGACELIESEPELYVPSKSACHWCRAKAICPALRERVLSDFETVVPETANTDQLGRVMASADMIENWIKAVRAEVERRLLVNEPVYGYKLVQGKRGNRRWVDAELAETALKAMRLPHKQMYDYKFVSPTTIEKMVKAEEIGPRQWAKMQELIVQSEGQPSVAPVSDKRPALVIGADASDFDDVTPSNETN